MIIPSLFDISSSILQIVALLLISASINQMLRGGVIIFTCLFSKLFLGRPIYKHHVVGVTFCLIGFILVGIASLTENTDLSTPPDAISIGSSGTTKTITGI